MPLNLPDTSKEIVDRSRADVQRELQQSNPFLKNSAIGAIITATCRRVFDFYLQLQIAVKQLVWSTATGEFLETWASIFNINRLPATPAFGNVVVTGIAGAIVPTSAALKAPEGSEYNPLSSATVSRETSNVDTLVSAGTLATCRMVSPHGYASGLEVTIEGANESVFNGKFAVTVTDIDEFTYTLPTSQNAPATGAITASAVFASLEVESSDVGAETNQNFGAVLTFISPITGIDEKATVDFGEIGGGTDIESDSDLQSRFLDRTQNPIAHFNEASISAKAKEVNGVTRVWVQSVTPDVGQVSVYFVRDNDESIIPSASEVSLVKWTLYNIMPVTMTASDLLVFAPNELKVDFNFSGIAPDTPSMRTAVTNSLEAFFRDQTDVGKTLESDAYRSAIWATVDMENGQQIESFDLNTPAGDIVVSSNEIQTLGTVTFP